MKGQHVKLYFDIDDKCVGREHTNPLISFSESGNYQSAGTLLFPPGWENYDPIGKTADQIRDEASAERQRILRSEILRLMKNRKGKA